MFGSGQYKSHTDDHFHCYFFHFSRWWADYEVCSLQIILNTYWRHYDNFIWINPFQLGFYFPNILIGLNCSNVAGCVCWHWTIIIWWLRLWIGNVGLNHPIVIRQFIILRKCLYSVGQQHNNSSEVTILMCLVSAAAVNMMMMISIYNQFSWIWSDSWMFN